MVDHVALITKLNELSKNATDADTRDIASQASAAIAALQRANKLMANQLQMSALDARDEINAALTD